MALIALWFRQTKEDKDKIEELHLKREMLEALQRLPISFGMALRTREKCKKVAKMLENKVRQRRPDAVPLCPMCCPGSGWQRPYEVSWSRMKRCAAPAVGPHEWEPVPLVFSLQLTPLPRVAPSPFAPACAVGVHVHPG